MVAFILRRLMQSAIVVVLMSLIVFVGLSSIENPVYMYAAPDATEEEIQRVIRAFGLDQPIHIQYLKFVQGALNGNLGNSYVFGQSALKMIAEHMPATMELAFAALVMAIVIGLPLGLFAGLWPDLVFSRTIMAGSILGFSLPSFWVGIMMIMTFSVMLGWLPSTGRGDTATFLGVTSSLFTFDGLSHILLPAINLALLKISLVIRLTRAGTREIMQLDYIKFARAKGLPFGRIVRVHLLKNILIPVVTVLGLEFGNLVAFSIVTETIFAWPGMGKMLISSIHNLDRPIIVAYLMMVVLIFVIINLVVDIIYSILDPRIRLQEKIA